jgi:hypothetical protein
MARIYTQNLTTRRNAVAILAIAPLAAAISVSPAPLSSVEKLEARLVVMRRNGLVRMHVSWCSKGAAMSAEERAGVLLNALDAPRSRGDPPVAADPSDDVREPVSLWTCEVACVIWRLGAGLFFIVNVQILDDGAVQLIGAPNKAAALSVAGAIVHWSISRWPSTTAVQPLRKGKVAGSNPAVSTKSAPLAQWQSSPFVRDRSQVQTRAWGTNQYK